MSSENNNYIDFHCHPAMKPFGKSFKRNKVINSKNQNSKKSIWYYDPPTLLDKLFNFVLGLTKFSQANFTSLAKGDVQIICASLYPIEKWFFENKIKNEFIQDLTANFATGVGKKRVDAVQAMTDYFKDLEMEYDFYKQLDGRIFKLRQGTFRYKLVRNYKDIKKYTEDSTMKVNTICVVLSIEGMHVLHNNINSAPDKASIMANIQKIKKWERPPFFVTVAHHFWNHFCGHARSFTSLVRKKVDQSEGLYRGFTKLGEEVVHSLLDDSNGKRILIDIKHMSVESRKDYYALLKSDPKYKDVPIIVSHGACNGMISFADRTASGSSVAKTFKRANINFFNEELIRIVKSKGIFALQLDERRVANKKTLKKTKNSILRNKIMHYRSKLLWNQIQHFLEVLDNEGRFAWDYIALGSDFDGIIDPLNAFWTAEELPYLADFLERHAFNFMSKAKLKVKKNIIDADEIVSRVMSTNGKRFLEKYFK